MEMVKKNQHYNYNSDLGTDPPCNTAGTATSNLPTNNQPSAPLPCLSWRLTRA